MLTSPSESLLRSFELPPLRSFLVLIHIQHKLGLNLHNRIGVQEYNEVNTIENCPKCDFRHHTTKTSHASDVTEVTQWDS